VARHLKRENEALVEQAKAILDLNWTGEYTQPGPRLYPHQWSNGLLPQIVFNPRFRDYFPGPSFWNASESPHAPRHQETSGVVMPPVHATAVLAVYKGAGEDAKEFFEYAFGKLNAWHDYLYRERDPRGEGLAYIRHPWESGMDNSPMWGSILLRLHLRAEQIPKYERADTHAVSAEDRPLDAAYDRFAYLVKFFAERDYDEARIREDCPFLVQDVLFNSLLCRSERDMAEVARILGEDPAPFEERAKKTAQAIEEKLWDEGCGVYFDYDLVAGRPIHVYFARTSCPCSPGSPTRRRPVWLNINWFLMRGLEDYGYREHADRLRKSIIRLCREEGFHEYFDPLTGQGHGSDLFSWSAALLIDVLAKGEE
jgi:hypothetical protein